MMINPIQSTYKYSTLQNHSHIDQPRFHRAACIQLCGNKPHSVALKVSWPWYKEYFQILLFEKD